MMDWDDIRKPAASQTGSNEVMMVGEVLDRYSIADLEHRIAALEAEIERVRQVLKARRDHEASIASVFKS